MSEVVKILATLMINGAQTPGRAICTSDLAAQCELTQENVAVEIEKLAREGYVEIFVKDDVTRIYLTQHGVVTASSIYS